mmetsp:Transcript_23261/g.64274  ORF Transcript_23261/g.64274 Transcript_23261/m.64274 type:complete len:205 (+) Transcript_23261:2850-3464(+)
MASSSSPGKASPASTFTTSSSSIASTGGMFCSCANEMSSSFPAPASAAAAVCSAGRAPLASSFTFGPKPSSFTGALLPSSLIRGVVKSALAGAAAALCGTAAFSSCSCFGTAVGSCSCFTGSATCPLGATPGSAFTSSPLLSKRKCCGKPFPSGDRRTLFFATSSSSLVISASLSTTVFLPPAIIALSRLAADLLSMVGSAGGG